MLTNTGPSGLLYAHVTVLLILTLPLCLFGFCRNCCENTEEECEEEVKKERAKRREEQEQESGEKEVGLHKTTTTSPATRTGGSSKALGLTVIRCLVSQVGPSRPSPTAQAGGSTPTKQRPTTSPSDSSPTASAGGGGTRAAPASTFSSDKYIAQVTSGYSSDPSTGTGFSSTSPVVRTRHWFGGDRALMMPRTMATPSPRYTTRPAAEHEVLDGVTNPVVIEVSV